MDDLTAPPSASKSSVTPARITWPGGPSKKQFFSLPSSIIYYILKNPSSPGVYIKLIKACKYFFENNPILVITSMYGNTVCSNEHSNNGDHKCCAKFDINKVSSKIWLTHELCLDGKTMPDFVTLLCTKLFRCDVHYLRIEDKVVLFDDLKSLISSAIIVSLCCSKIVNKEDSSDVMLEKVVESLSNIEHFSFFCDDNASMVTASTMNNVAQLENFQQLETFDMLNIPEIVRIEDLSNIIQDHENICFQLHFSPDISVDYMDQIDGLIDTVIESEVPNRMINYLGQNKGKFKIMKSRFDDGDIFGDDDEEMMEESEEESGDDENGEEMEEYEYDEELMEDD